jgi:amino acid adenylation domain-containing protein
MIHELFEIQAKRTPDAVAVIHNNEPITYRALKRRKDDLVDQLQGLGLRPGQVVAFSVSRGPRAISAMLAILQCDSAFLPIDSKLPGARQDQLLQIAAAELLVNREGIIRLHGNSRADPVVPENTAYVLFTSGTTGVPKAVCVPHRAVVRLVRDVDYVRLDQQTRFLHLAPLSFDACMLEIWGALLNGGTIVVHPNDLPDLAELGLTIAKHGVTTAWLTASLFNKVIDINPEILLPLRELLTGGEPLSVPHVLRALALLPNTTLINGYGPTEAATFTTTFKIPRNFHATAPRVPIGRPLPDTQVYVLDEHQQLQPMGVPGEIYIGGSGVATGYLGDEALTSAKFLPDKFGHRAGAFIYRTGDLGYLLADGNLDFLGRRDNQVKIRGFRIELAEIGAVITQHPSVSEAVVLTKEDDVGEKRLAAYVVTKGPVELCVSALREFLREKLPDYMVPWWFVILDRLPLAPNGKVDRSALPAPKDKMIEVEQSSLTPTTLTEQVLCQIWRKRLNLERVGMQDNFFDLGGHSLLAVSVVGEINKTFKAHLNVATFFQNPTIESLARVLERKDHIRSQPPVLPLQLGHIEPSLYFIIAILPELRLAQLIRSQRSICGIDPTLALAWCDAAAKNNIKALPTMEELAAPYVTALMTHIGTSSCLLIGYSAGGLIAFEAARQFQKRGGTVEMVILIDTQGKQINDHQDLVLARGTRFVRRLRRYWRRGLNQIVEHRKSGAIVVRLWRLISILSLISAIIAIAILKVSRYCVSCVNSYVLSIKSKADPLPDNDPTANEEKGPTAKRDERGSPVYWHSLGRLYRNAALSYEFRPIDCRGILLRAREAGRRSVDLGWKNLFLRGLEIVHVPGNHNTLILEPNNLYLANEINKILNDLERIPMR